MQSKELDTEIALVEYLPAHMAVSAMWAGSGELFSVRGLFFPLGIVFGVDAICTIVLIRDTRDNVVPIHERAIVGTFEGFTVIA